MKKISNTLNKVAREPLVKIVNQQRLKDIALKEKQIITTKVESLEIEDQTKNSILIDQFNIRTDIKGKKDKYFQKIFSKINKKMRIIK